MRVLFCTQSESLILFDALRNELSNHINIEEAGFVVADNYAYGKWLKTKPEFEKKGYHILKEWEVTAQRKGKPDLEKLAQYEKELGGEAGLFGAIVADRRLFMGPDCTYTQDYRRRFSDEELLCILQSGLERTEELFNRLKPEVIVSFICVTMLDYLVYLFAKARGVRVLNLKPTRVGDRVGFSGFLNDPSPEFAEAYQRILKSGRSDFFDEADKYILRVREQHGRYEGVVSPSDRPALKADLKKFSRIRRLVKSLKDHQSYLNSEAAKDNHVPNPIRALWFSGVLNPRRAKKLRNHLKDKYLHESDLKDLRYVFFPLHTEPEVSLLVYGRPYVNQTEIIRMLAMSLPVDMVLVVKEHPWMVGKRSLSAYDKMLSIPRVRLVDPRLDARTLVQSSQLVAVVTGSVALEAAMLGKPVITLGDCPYNLLPETMVRRCEDPRHLQILIRDLLKSHSNNDEALKAYVSAVYETTSGVNLYSVLLGKKNVFKERSTHYLEEIRKLASEVLRFLNSAEQKESVGSARW